MRKITYPALIIISVLLASTSLRAADPWAEPLENVYWGDLHVHTAYSLDAFLLGMCPGRYVDEAGQYASYCGRLDFYSVTDHASLISNTNYWEENIRAARHFNQLGRDNPDKNGDPSIVVFPGWEWTLNYIYGHKNVILKYDDPKKLPPYPIRCRPGIQGYPEIARKIEIDMDGDEASFYEMALLAYGTLSGYMKGDDDTTFLAPTSGELFEKLRQYCTEAGTGCEALVIPHGTAWRITPPSALTSWTAQLDPINHDPEIQRLIEVYSKHGNSEQYSFFPPMWRYLKNGSEVKPDDCLKELEPGWKEKFSQNMGGGPNPTELLPGCEKKCPEPTAAFVPCCWRAGEIVAKRCLDPKSEFCKEQIEKARATVKPFPDPLTEAQLEKLKPLFRESPGKTNTADWGECGQCLDCYQPAANYQTNGSVQKALASAWFDEQGKPLHYRFGFIASTDTHSAWSGSVKETKRMAESQMRPNADSPTPDYPAWERVDNFLNPGGLAAILAEHRTRDQLWDSMARRNVYSTSGARIEVWARAVLDEKVVKMGSEIFSTTNPSFHIKANGAFVEDDTCPYDDEPLIQQHMSKDEFKRVCGNQCYRVTDQRVAIARIEIVKILQPMSRQEADMKNLERSPDNPGGLIMDPYFIAEFDQPQIEWSWTDDQFENEPSGRSVAYYFRVIQKPTPGYNCNPIALLKSGKSCNLKDPRDSLIEAKINPQDGREPKPLLEIDDPCYSDPQKPETFCEERAWTSPFYIIRN